MDMRETGEPRLEPGDFAWCSVFAKHWPDGNPTIVIRLESWLDDGQLAAIAACLGNETTFFTWCDGDLQMRWFAAEREVPLCGHGALAAATLLIPELRNGQTLAVRNHPDRLWVKMQAGQVFVVFRRPELRATPEQFQIGVRVVEAFDAGRDYLLIVEDEESLRRFRPVPGSLESLPKIGCILSAPSSSGTAAFRFFAPQAGISEDRASGSVIPALVEYWKHKQPARPYAFHQESGYGICIQADEDQHGIAVGGEVRILARGRITPSVLNRLDSTNRNSRQNGPGGSRKDQETVQANTPV